MEAQMTSEEARTVSRRTFVRGGGAMVVGFSLAGTVAGQALARSSAGTPAAWPKPNVNLVDSFLEIRADNSIVAKVGKGTGGMGLLVSIQQLFADELDVPMNRITMWLGDSYTTPDQVGATGSNGMQTEWVTVRQAAATARQELLRLASVKLGVPVSSLTVKDGAVLGNGTSLTYGQLIGGQTFNLAISAAAPQKAPSALTVAGKSTKRPEIPRIVTGNYDYVNDVRLPGMLHARNIKPPVAGATLVSVNGPHNLPGLVKVVSKGNYLAVVAKTEWQAIQASHALDVTWKKPATPPFPNGYDELYEYMRTSTPKATSVAGQVGNVNNALANAARKLSATYMSDFQSHASFAGTCAVADVRDGSCRIWFGGQKPYGVLNTISDLLKMPVANIRSTWYPGPGSYGRNDADDGGLEAAYLSSVVGAPVRVQWMRDEVQGWDAKGPAHTTTIDGGIDANGKVTAWNWTSYQISTGHTAAAASRTGDTLIGNLMGIFVPAGTNTAVDSTSYAFPNMLKTTYTVPWDQALGTGLRSANFRDPNGPQTTFAAEQFIDELAYAAGLDPMDFRLTYLNSARDRNVLQQVRHASGWVSRPGPNKQSPTAKVVSGRGVAYQTRGGTVVAQVAKVDVDRKTGDVKVRSLTTGLDAGFIVNPSAVTGAIKAAAMMSIGRALHESVRFNREKVLSVDWETYPIASIHDAPKMNVVLVNQNGVGVDGQFVAPTGAGEPPCRPVAAAIANAVFDATGVRVRRQPMTKEIVLKALREAGKAV